MQFIFTTGNLADGFIFVGPFDSNEEALKYAEDYADDGNSWGVLELQVPASRYEEVIADGRSKGEAAASWVYIDSSNAADILAKLQEGDPEVMDSMPASPLSGEMGGESMVEILGDLADDEEAQQAFEDAFVQGWTDEVERMCRYHLPEPGDTVQIKAIKDLCKRWGMPYVEGDWGPSFGLPADYLCGTVGKILPDGTFSVPGSMFVGVAPDGRISS